MYLTCHEKELPKIGEAREKPKLIFKALPTFKDVFGNIANLQNLLVICHHQYAPPFARFYQSKLSLLKKKQHHPGPKIYYKLTDMNLDKLLLILFVIR